jgi:large subunit ribosomal protein L17
MAFAFVQDNEVITKVFEELAPKYKERPGGYTRIMKVGYRPGDAAPVALIELV